MLEQVFESLKRGDRRKTFLILDYFWARLAMHIRAEHLHLFPALLEKACAPGLPESLIDVVGRLPDDIATLKRDHDIFIKEIGKDVNRLRVGDDAKAENLDLGDVCKNLMVIAQRLEVHNELEERDIYPLAQALLTADEVTDLKVSIAKELANIPPRFRRSLP